MSTGSTGGGPGGMPGGMPGFPGMGGLPGLSMEALQQFMQVGLPWRSLISQQPVLTN